MNKKQLPKIFTSKTPKVYKNNQLNTANFGNFNLNDYQVFLHLVSKVGGVDRFGKYLQPKELVREHLVTAEDFSKTFNTDIDNTYKILNKACKKLMSTSVLIDGIENGKIYEVNVCSRAIYDKNKGRINIKFTDDIMPYLSQINQQFVLYNIREISNFHSIYTTRLYELIQQFKDTGYMIKSVDQLRNIFAVGKKFKEYASFKKRTFNHACKEINANYKMNLDYEEIKEGRKIVAIKFKFKKTKIHQRVNNKTGVRTNVYIKPELVGIGEELTNVIEAKEAPDKNSIKNILPKIIKKLKFFS